MTPTPENKNKAHKVQRGRRLYMALAGLGAAALMSSAALSTASAHGHCGKRGGHGIMRVLNHADLTDAQETKIKAIKDKYKPVLKAQFKEGKGTRRGLRELLTADKISDAQAEKLRQEFLEHQEQRSAVMRDMMLDIAKVLTPAQRKKLAQKMEERRAKWESKHAERKAKRDRNSGH